MARNPKLVYKKEFYEPKKHFHLIVDKKVWVGAKCASIEHEFELNKLIERILEDLAKMPPYLKTVVASMRQQRINENMKRHKAALVGRSADPDYSQIDEDTLYDLINKRLKAGPLKLDEKKDDEHK